MLLTWSIYKDTSGNVDDWVENSAAFYHDEDINASERNRLKFFEDGIHEVWFEKKSTFIEVKDGKFDIRKVKPLIANIVEGQYWGTFIEGFTLYRGKFWVCMGS